MTRGPAMHMGGAITDIDHLMVHVHDADAAGRAFEALGFTVTPKSVMVALGLSNRCVLFRPAVEGCCNYIELMAREDPARVPPFMHDILGDAEGPVSLVMATPDAQAAADQLADTGVACQPPFAVTRDWHLADGVDVQVSFAVCIPTTGQSPIYWNLCEHRTRQHYVRPDVTTHANGAVRISGIDAVAPDAAQVASTLARQWGTKVSADADDAVLVAPGAVTLAIRKSAQRRITGLRIEGLNLPEPVSLYGLDLIPCPTGARP